MAEETIGGFEGGRMAIQTHQAQMGIFQQTMQEGAIKIEDDGVKLKEAKIALKQQEDTMTMFQKLLANPTPGAASGTPGPPMDMITAGANVLATHGFAAAMSGDTVHGEKELSTASTMLHNQVEIAKAHVEVAQKAFDWIEKKSQMYPHTAEGFEQLKSDYTNEYQKPVPKDLAGPYNPAIWGHIEEASQTVLQRANTAHAQAAAELDRSAVARNKAQTALDKIKAENERRKADADKKNGNLKLAPTQAQINQVSERVLADIGDKAPTDLLIRDRAKSIALDVATDALDLVRSRDIPWNSAVDQAWKAFQPKLKEMKMGVRRELVGTMEYPQRLAASFIDAKTAATLKDGQWYEFGPGPKEGMVAQYDAKSRSFKAAPAFNTAGFGDSQSDQEDPDSGPETSNYNPNTYIEAEER